MRSALSQFEVHSPRSLNEALQLLDANPTLRPLSGGTDIMVELNEGHCKSKGFLNLSYLHELNFIEERDDELWIGARASYSDCMQSAVVADYAPLLNEAARLTGGPQIQNLGTLAGNVANASPAADVVVALLACDAKVEAISVEGTRQIALSDFFLSYRKTALRHHELIRALILSTTRPVTHQFFRKVGTRSAQAISKVVLAGEMNLNPDNSVSHLRLAAGSLSATSLRLKFLEQALLNKTLKPDSIAMALELLPQHLQPIDDIRSSADYRLQVTHNVLRAFFESALN